MRQTCARVLAAALITGVFAVVAGTSALFGTPSEPTQRLAAPPIALERSVRITVAPRPAPRTQTISPPARPAVVTRQLVVIHTKPRPKLQRTPESVPKPALPAVPRELASTPQPPPSPPQPAATIDVPAPAAENGGDDKEHPGQAYGHDKHQEGHGHQEHTE